VSADARAERAARLLAARGFAGAEVTVEGHEREIAAVRVPAGAWGRLAGEDGARVAAEVRALGFRYVALDLAPEG
jgi:PP-loop superfamily ATP-utilizing enzyme